MKRPQSVPVKGQFWTSFKQKNYSILTQEYPHQTFMEILANKQNPKSSFQLKDTISNNNGAVKIDNQLAFWFQLKQGKSIYSAIRSNYLKIHYDNGITDFSGRKYNFYASWQSEKDLKENALKIGSCYLSDKVACNNRIKIYKFKGHSGLPQFTYYHKSQGQHSNFKFGLFFVYNISTRVLANNAIFIGYQKNKNQFFIRAQNQWRDKAQKIQKTQNYFTDLVFNYAKKIDQNATVALQVPLYNKNNVNRGVNFAYEKKIPEENTTLKWRFSSALKFAFMIKRGMGSYGNYSVGFEIEKLGNKNEIKIGSQIDLNL